MARFQARLKVCKCMVRLCLKSHKCESERPCLETRFSFPNLSLREFQVQNGVIETGPCFGVKTELMKLSFGGPQTL